MRTTIRPKTRSVKPGREPDCEAAEICALTERSVDELLTRRETEALGPDAQGRRRALRWPFPGTVELWIPDEQGRENYALATAVNLSRDGMGIAADQPIADGTSVQVAIHEPEVTFHGQAVVRHCTESEDGSYLVGLQFSFDAA